jgi:rhamnulokinase
MLGSLDMGGLRLEEVHRFPNGGVRLGRHLYWDVLRLWSEIKAGLQRAGSEHHGEIKSIGVDTWGVDFGLLDANDNLIGNPYHYRDPHTDGMMAAVFARVPKQEVYAQTGAQFIQFNSLYQLFAMLQSGDPALDITKIFLNIPDLFNFFLTGFKASEFSIATTTQCYNPSTQAWAFDLLNALELPTHIFGQIVPSGTLLGGLRPEISEELGLPSATVVASAGHDTASAVAAVPAAAADFLYISSGTWSLVGVELEQPLISAESLEANITNEGGVGGKFRFLKNIIGLWLVQECRRQWAQAGMEHSYADLSRMAAKAPAFGPLIDAADPRFLAPRDMPAAIQACCRESGQAAPQDKGAILRCALESLALEYRRVAEQIDRLTGIFHPTIHIIGGGSQNRLLNQLTAKATGRTVIAGPAEATAIGNILVQAIAMGEISSLAEGREIVRNSIKPEIYEPQMTSEWDEAYERYLAIKIGQQR